MAEARHPYLVKHNLPTILDTIMAKLLLLQPHHPMVFIIGECTEAEQENRRKALNVATGLGNYPDFTGKHSLISKVLDQEMYKQMFNLRTSFGGTLDDVVQTGVDISEFTFCNSCGLVATDSHCYPLFSPLFDGVLKLKYPFWDNSYQHDSGTPSITDIYKLPESKVIKGSYCLLARSVAGSAYPSLIKRGDRRLIATSIEQIISKQIGTGTFFKGKDLPKRTGEASLGFDAVRDFVKIPTDQTSDYDLRLNVSRDWPDGRVIWWAPTTGDDPTHEQAVWGCFREHIEVRSCCQLGGETKMLESLFETAKTIESGFENLGSPLSYNARYGSLVSSPENLGTSFTYGVVLAIPYLAVHPRFDDILNSQNLTATLTSHLVNNTYYGLPTHVLARPASRHPNISFATTYLESPSDVCVHYREKLGVTVGEVLKKTIKTVHNLLALEELLERGQSADDEITKLL
eukprot:TRINITY_DN11613_c4_g1_i1.p1 TRINITY_DN11613_c4_g1~~TRINITY_DN11613_c4_g1_i1.p1  ORF type:complete len:468 (+),score=29.31 TRINITY_DN11613_c4_g1_i1:26-1405(+)